MKKAYSVVRLTDYWYIACASDELGPRELKKLEILSTPLVLFRDGKGQPSVLLDRCPHRNAPLSFGTRLATGRLRCGYHGWEFDGDGECCAVPGLVGEPRARGRRAMHYPTREQQGFIWVYMNPQVEEPERDPFLFPHLDDRRYTSARRNAEAEGTMFHTIENALDVPHTAYLHAGLHRSNTTAKNKIEAVVRVFGDRVEAEYIGEPRPPGLAGRILAPKGGVVQHWDRFILPNISQVEYMLGERNHIVITSTMVPVSDFFTRLHAIVSFRTVIPGWLVQPVIEPIARRIFDQDAVVLKLQTETVQRFDGEHFVSTEIDVLGLHIWKLLEAAERGEASDEPGDPRTETQLELLI